MVFGRLIDPGQSMLFRILAPVLERNGATGLLICPKNGP
jgi:hypothetical protein